MRPKLGLAGQALGWSFVNTALGRFGTLALGIALARLLGPEQFGTFAVANIALLAILSFNELGVSLAIVRWKDEPDSIAPTVATVSLVTSALLTALAVIAAPAFAGAMGAPAATLPVRLLSMCVLIDGLVATPAALLQRAFRQRERMVADQVNTWTGAVVSLALAATGLGAVSLAIGRLTGSALSAVLFLRLSPLPYRLGFDRAHLRRLLWFGLPLAGASGVVFVVGFVDQVVVGHLLGSVVLGYYVLAVNLSMWPLNLFSQPLRMVAPAMFARLQHDQTQMQKSFGDVLHLLAALALPVCAVLSVAAPDVVRFVYGEVWAPAGSVLRWLAALAALRILFELAYDYLVVAGRSMAILALQVAWIVALVPAVWAGVTLRGIDGAGPAVVGVALCVSVPLYVAILSRAGVSWARTLAALRLPVVGALCAAASAALVPVLMSSPVVVVLLSGVVGGVAAIALLWHSRAQFAALRLATAR